ncbi:TPA: WD repeat-containing protein 4 [Trebouxia sp. C0004]
MAPKKNANKKHKHAKLQNHTALQHRPDPSVACFALHPRRKFVAIAVNDVVRISDPRQSLSEARVVQRHAAPIRAVAFDATGKYFLTAGDEKLVKVWDTMSWSLLQTINSPKKITAAVFSNNSSLVAFADKFGDVLTAKLQPSQSAPTSGPAAPLLGHLCSIVTSLAFSPDGRQLVSTDQDCKVRVSTMPSEPHKGAHSIQSMCMGHEVFAKCCSFGYHQNGSQPILLSGGGDSTIRSWRYLSGQQLDCFTCTTQHAAEGSIEEAAPVSSLIATSADGGVPPASAILQSDAAKHDLGGDDDDAAMDAAQVNTEAADEGVRADANGTAAAASGDDTDPEEIEMDEEGNSRGLTAAVEVSSQPAVLSISVAPDGCTVAAAVEGRDTVLILHCNPISGQLSQQQEVQLPGVSLPTQVQIDSEGKLWVVGGPLSGSTDATCIGVADCIGTGSNKQVS